MTVSVREDHIAMIAGDALWPYQFGRRTAEHSFRGASGCYTDHRRASGPSAFGVNVGGLEGVSPAALGAVPSRERVHFHSGQPVTKECG
jgi:hypothetical protein